MTLTAAIPFLKGAVARSTGKPSLYMFHEGRMFARSPAVLASHPVPHILGTFALSAKALEDMIDRMPTEPTVGTGDGTLVFRSGRLRSSIDLVEAAEPEGTLIPDDTWPASPKGLIPALRSALPFVPSAGSWQMSVRLDEGRVQALGNRGAVEIQVDGLQVHGHVALSTDCVEYLGKMRTEPSGWFHTNSAVIFAWPSGAWVRCQKTALEWPPQYSDPDFIDGVIKKIDIGDPVQITDEWRESYEDIAALGDGEVTVFPDGLIGRAQGAEHVAEFETGVRHETLWDIKMLKSVFEVADVWHPDAEGGPAPFFGPGGRGIVMGRRK